MLVVTRQNLRDQATLKRITDILKKILQWLNKEAHQIRVLVLCVLSKIDEYFDGQRLCDVDIEEVNKRLTNALIEINKHLHYRVEQRVAVSARQKYHIDHLFSILNVNSPLNAQIILNQRQYFANHRQTMATKIITAFAAANAAISLLPAIDILIIRIMDEWMFKILACFSVDPSRTADMFIRLKSAQHITVSILRTGLLLLGDAMELTGIAFLAGAGISATTASLTTAKLGWDCYSYMTKED